MKRNISVSILASLFAATVAYGETEEVVHAALADGTIMEDVQPVNLGPSAAESAAIESPFPSQGPDDK